LVRRGLYELTNRHVSLEAFEDQAARDEAWYGDHLRRMLVAAGARRSWSRRSTILQGAPR